MPVDQLHDERMRTMIVTALDHFIEVDSEGRFVEWNSRAEKSFGWSREQALGRPSHIIVPERYHERYDSELRKLLALGPLLALDKPARIKGLHRDGREFPAELTIAPIQQGAAYGLMPLVRDLIERRPEPRFSSVRIEGPFLQMNHLKSLIREVPDFPKPGILFYDI